ncbi:hypothetical protein CK516_27375 [Nostoc sp. 'Peltigera malacea cyanobiont' DB3992]|nr:hypothetical protein CK516_27375 [Nostoc sp. 'Peltigera malacea cyanobiont' DB3992]
MTNVLQAFTKIYRTTLCYPPANFDENLPDNICYPPASFDENLPDNIYVIRQRILTERANDCKRFASNPA